jgi:hypothetical protein
VAALVRSGLTGLEALLTHTLTGRGFTPRAAQATRGWSDEQWAAGLSGLQDRGLVADGELTETGTRIRTEVEQETDALSAAPFEHLGAERTERVAELAGLLTGRVVAAGAFPAGTLARG